MLCLVVGSMKPGYARDSKNPKGRGRAEARQGFDRAARMTSARVRRPPADAAKKWCHCAPSHLGSRAPINKKAALNQTKSRGANSSSKSGNSNDR